MNREAIPKLAGYVRSVPTLLGSIRTSCWWTTQIYILLALFASPVFLSARDAKIPPGSYQRSCADIRMEGTILSAVCGTRDGRWVPAELKESEACGGIENVDGKLICIRSQAGPPGPYLLSCQGSRVRGGVLSARCPSSVGQWLDTSIDFKRCINEIGNFDGHLTCALLARELDQPVTLDDERFKTARRAKSGVLAPNEGWQINRDEWTLKDGAPEDVTAMAQSADGYLWLGAPTGLFNFDGSRFQRFRSPFGDQLLSTNVNALFAPRSGGLWVGYRFGGMSFLSHGRITNYGGNFAEAAGRIYSIAQDKGGVVWAATRNGLWRFEHSEWRQAGEEWNVPEKWAARVGLDREGNLWMVTAEDRTLFYLRQGSRRFQIVATNMPSTNFSLDEEEYVLTGDIGRSKDSPIASEASDEDRFPMVIPIRLGEIVDRANGAWYTESNGLFYRAPSGARTPGPKFQITTNGNPAILDCEGDIWLTSRTSLYRFFYTPLIQNDLPDFAGRPAIAADEEGRVWVGSEFWPGPLYRLSVGKAVPLPRTHDVRLSLAYRALDGTMWLGAIEKGLWHETVSRQRPTEATGPTATFRKDLWEITGRDWERIDLPQEIAGQALYVHATTQDRRGGLWLSVAGHGLYRLAGGVWTRYGGRADFPKAEVVSEFTDSLGRVWFGYTNNQVAVLDGDRIQVFGPRDGLHIGNIMAIYGRGGMIWIGGEFGLQVYDQGRILDIKAIDDELLRGISGIIETANGDLWLNGLSGIFHIRQADLYRALTALDYRVKGERFSKEDGLPGFATQIRPLPTVIESGDGRLWFAQSDGVVWLDPACAEKIVMTPPVTIQSISADDKTYDIVLPLRLPAHTASVQITYTAVSLSAPTAIRYRYQLNGIDAAWHEVLTSSAITYRNLGPAAYHFRVQASDTNGSWSTKVETLDFTILPAYYQALWFRLLLLTVFLGLLMLAYRLRLQQLSRQYSIRLEARVEERTRVARELHDTLLQGFHGVIYRFQAARDMLPRRTDEAIEALEGALERAEQAVAEGRDAIHDLRSSTLVANELAQAVTALGQEMSRELDSDHGAAQFHVVVEGTPRDLHPTLRDEVYAIVREAVRNAFRHARAHHIEVEIRYSGNALQLRVRDDGKGVDPDIVAQGRSGHFGVPGMRERATRIGGSLDVWTATGTGTEIALSIPGSIAYGSASTGRILKLFGKKATEL